jgi:phospholipid/cholesterol/gamma-HCH transport system substrate-binding protein
MENRSHALMTGFFTIALLVGAVLAGIWFNRDRTERVPYQIVTTQSIPGLNPQATVRYRGLEVGKVDAIAFDPKKAGQIVIRIAVDREAPVTRTTFATLGYQGVTGIAFIQLDDEQVGSALLASDADRPGTIPLRPGLLDQIEKRGLLILAQSEEITRSIATLMSPQNQKTLIDAVDNIGKTAAAFGAVPAQLEPTLARLPALSLQAEQSLRKFDAFTASATRTSDQFDLLATELRAPSGPIARLNGTIERVGGALDGVTSELELHTLPQVTAMSDEARAALRTARRTMNSLNERPQSLLFGAARAEPGPGEAGFAAPTK